MEVVMSEMQTLEGALKLLRSTEDLLFHVMRERDAYRDNLTAAQASGSKLALRVQAQANAITKAIEAIEAGTIGHDPTDEVLTLLRSTQ
jgi:hypothetical protein